MLLQTEFNKLRCLHHDKIKDILETVPDGVGQYLIDYSVLLPSIPPRSASAA